jgi:GNAT superfamily N-acetyltransferase
MPTLRDARPADSAALVRIAAEGGSPDADDAHLSFVGRVGRVLVAETAEGPVGFAGVVPVGTAQMVTDLFVSAAHRGNGVGGLLLAEVLDPGLARFTFSSPHPAAVAAYRKAGMSLLWPLLTMRGASEGGAQPVERAWAGAPSQVVAHLMAQGAVCTGAALVDSTAELARVHRLEASADAAVDALREVLRGLPPGTATELSVPAGSPLVGELVLRGFRIVDVDLHCATADARLDPRLAVVHRGLC